MAINPAPPTMSATSAFFRAESASALSCAAAPFACESARMPKVPLTTGPEAHKPNTPVPSQQALGKTAAPGKANSMTDAEWRAFKREQGISY